MSRRRPRSGTTPGVDWAAFDLVVVRSTWDYPGRRASSSPGPSRCPTCSTRRRCCAGTPTSAISSSRRRTQCLRPVPRARRTVRAADGPFVVKPSVGAGSIGAARYEAGDEPRTRARAPPPRGRKDGAWSSRTSRQSTTGRDDAPLSWAASSRTPSARAPAEHGRRARRGPLRRRDASPPPSPRRRARSGRARAGRGAVRARRAALRPRRPHRGRRWAPLVLEVELTEPSLFLGYADGAAERFADAIVAARLCDGAAGRFLGPRDPQRACLRHRQVQLPLPVLHAGRGSRVARRATRSSATRRSRGSCGCCRDGRRRGPADRRRAARPPRLPVAGRILWPRPPASDDLSLTTNGVLLDRSPGRSSRRA